MQFLTRVTRPKTPRPICRIAVIAQSQVDSQHTCSKTAQADTFDSLRLELESAVNPVIMTGEVNEKI
jgi:hypothetical protein